MQNQPWYKKEEIADTGDHKPEQSAKNMPLIQLTGAWNQETEQGSDAGAPFTNRLLLDDYLRLTGMAVVR